MIEKKTAMNGRQQSLIKKMAMLGFEIEFLEMTIQETKKKTITIQEVPQPQENKGIVEFVGTSIIISANFSHLSIKKTFSICQNFQLLWEKHI